MNRSAIRFQGSLESLHRSAAWRRFASALRGFVIAPAALLALAHLALLLPLRAAAVSPPVVPPVGAGPFPVACSNVEQDFSRLLPGESADLYWEGVPADGRGRYVTNLLRDPAGALQLSVRVPDRREVFSDFADQAIPYALIVCYPTDASNLRHDYPLPNGVSVPRMQRGGEPPIWPAGSESVRWPLLVYAHGLGGSPLASEYLITATLLATHGYVVVAPFFADARFSRLRIEELSDLTFLLTRFDRVVAMQAVRPIAVSQALDYVLAHPEWRDRLDASRIGGFGASLGGETLLLAAGARLTVTLGQSSTQVTYDPRIKAVVGYVPYFGPRLFPAFGASESGLDPVSVPFLGIAGTADTTSPIAMVEQGVNRMQGPRFVVAFEGTRHELVPNEVPDLLTWSLGFLDTYVKDSRFAHARIAAMNSVAGGANDVKRVGQAGPPPPLPPAADNYQGMWAVPNLAEAGWGINFTHQGDVIFASWFTYDAGSRPWWLTMTAHRQADGTFAGVIDETRGPPFHSVQFDSSPVTHTAVGSGRLTFSDANTASFAYTVNGVSRVKPLARFVFASPVPICRFDEGMSAALALNYQGMWAVPNLAESGWGINFTHQGDTIFASWFTYDAAGVPWWLTATLAQVNGSAGLGGPFAGRTYAGTLDATAGPPFHEVPFEPSKVTHTPVGTATVTFLDGASALFAYSVGGVSQTKPLVPFVFRAQGTICD